VECNATAGEKSKKYTTRTNGINVSFVDRFVDLYLNERTMGYFICKNYLLHNKKYYYNKVIYFLLHEHNDKCFLIHPVLY